MPTNDVRGSDQVFRNVVTASFVFGGNILCATTLMAWVSLYLADLQNTLSREHHFTSKTILVPKYILIHCSRGRKVFKIHNLTDVEATLVEPAACAVHGVDKLQAPVGAEALVIGAGPTGNPTSI